MTGISTMPSLLARMLVILLPAVQHATDRKLINREESIVLKAGARLQNFRLADIEALLGDKSKRQVSYLLKKMKEGGMVCIFPEGSRTYRVSFNNKILMGGRVKRLAEEGFIPNLDG